MAGKLFRPGGPKGGEAVQVRATGDGLDVQTAGGPLALPWRALDAKLAGFEDAYVALGADLPEGRVEVWLERAFVGELDAYARFFSPGFTRVWTDLRATDRRRKGARVGLRAVGLLLAVGLVWGLLGGGCGTLVARAVPLSVDRFVGQAGWEDFARDAKPCVNPEAEHALRAVLDAVLAEERDNPFAFELHLVGDADPNMFALPGGIVAVTGGMLPLLDDPSMAAAALGHEAQHALGRHWLDQFAQRAGLVALVTVVFGDVSGVLALLGDLQALRYGRALEREADRVGFELATRARFDPTGAERMFRRLGEARVEAGGIALGFLQSHPLTDDRVAAAREAAAGVHIDAIRELPAIDWAAVRRGCAPPATPPAETAE